jgi:hypothetical protein
MCTQSRTGEDFTTEGGSITNLTSGPGVSPPELSSRPKITPDEDNEMVEMSRGTSLLLAARERVLSLSEQRVRLPIIRIKLTTWTQGGGLDTVFSGPQASLGQVGEPPRRNVRRYTSHRI